MGRPTGRAVACRDRSVCRVSPPSSALSSVRAPRRSAPELPPLALISMRVSISDLSAAQSPPAGGDSPSTAAAGSPAADTRGADCGPRELAKSASLSVAAFQRDDEANRADSAQETAEPTPRSLGPTEHSDGDFSAAEALERDSSTEEARHASAWRGAPRQARVESSRSCGLDSRLALFRGDMRHRQGHTAEPETRAAAALVAVSSGLPSTAGDSEESATPRQLDADAVAPSRGDLAAGCCASPRRPPLLTLPPTPQTGLSAGEDACEGATTSRRSEEERRRMADLLSSTSAVMTQRLHVLKQSMETKEAMIDALLVRCREREDELESVNALLVPLMAENAELKAELETRKQDIEEKDMELSALRHALHACLRKPPVSHVPGADETRVVSGGGERQQSLQREWWGIEEETERARRNRACARERHRQRRVGGRRHRSFRMLGALPGIHLATPETVCLSADSRMSSLSSLGSQLTRSLSPRSGAASPGSAAASSAPSSRPSAYRAFLKLKQRRRQVRMQRRQRARTGLAGRSGAPHDACVDKSGSPCRVQKEGGSVESAAAPAEAEAERGAGRGCRQRTAHEAATPPEVSFSGGGPPECGREDKEKAGAQEGAAEGRQQTGRNEELRAREGEAESPPGGCLPAVEKSALTQKGEGNKRLHAAALVYPNAWWWSSALVAHNALA
ncbi:hypothetical protein BESB_015800 [Besnoitia besnoiti]|uniref:Uncharacterized protein n=1 Tax=Besnoitia besnoiti TaxID=94643 RepID=A0A2A9MA43_BESBE|nr:hypothetical protein BESB_015800 [Besnoitia besnoiti]PFH32262.1 hypothetical protein BESB_015800 [Besnoitia besnoiti]